MIMQVKGMIMEVKGMMMEVKGMMMDLMYPTTRHNMQWLDAHVSKFTQPFC